ncbi:TAXI family TRAP transporter solute-binding subunit [Novispirillum sp. DQ9]|uniref:TAXI family TRAP transporter solute-binding subunit n=1 Tax=Novispirillum sp. DQ9 TaxID=3398612 RepID=UPI003C7A3E9C
MPRFALARLFSARALGVLGLVVLAAVPLSIRSATAQSDQGLTFMRIGTGPTGGGYFPMGGLIGNAISNPPGSRPCDRGGSCGVPGLIAAAVSTNGAVENIDAIRRGTMELALAQADVAYWAYHGTGPYKDKGAVENLRAVAMLYQESFHLVARNGSGIEKVTDLKGKRVSLGEEGSGTLIDALLILEAHGLSAKTVKPSYLKPGAAADALLAGEIDAFFFVAGAPVTTISTLTADDKAHLVPIDGEPAAKLTKAYPFLTSGEIAADVYPHQPAVRTINVGAVLVADAALSESLVYGITQALWHPNNQTLFRKGHPGGAQMSLETATEGMGIALHAGAANYYFDAGVE